MADLAPIGVLPLTEPATDFALTDTVDLVRVCTDRGLLLPLGLALFSDSSSELRRPRCGTSLYAVRKYDIALRCLHLPTNGTRPTLASGPGSGDFLGLVV